MDKTAATGRIRYPTTPEFDFVWRADCAPADACLPVDNDDEMDLPFAPAQNAIGASGAIAAQHRLGRIADWTAAGAANADRRGTGQGGFRSSRVVTTHASAAREDVAGAGAGWSQVATEVRVASSLGQGDRRAAGPPGGDRRGPPGTDRRGPPGSGPGAMRRPGPRMGGWGPRFATGPNALFSHRKREPSVVVHADWALVEDIEFSRLAKLQVDASDAVPAGDNAARTGTPAVYDPSCDRALSARVERALPALSPADIAVHESAHATFAPLDIAEPSLLQYTPPPVVPEDDAEPVAVAGPQPVAAVLDADVAALVMACQRTVIPWDVVVHRARGGDTLYVERRADANATAVHVNETAPGDAAPADDGASVPAGAKAPTNTSGRLAAEASAVAAQLPALLANGSVPADAQRAARYTHVSLGAGCTVLVRTHTPLVDAEGRPVIVVPLLEYEQKVGGSSLDWRTRLDTQRGAVLAHEIRNNSALLARSVFTAMLAGARVIKVAFVARAVPRDRTRHVLLGVQDYEPHELASQMNLNVPNGFGVLRALLDLCAARTPASGAMSLVREPNRAILRLYRLPGTGMSLCPGAGALPADEDVFFAQGTNESILSQTWAPAL